jgi:mannose-6-phosphate isomerase-like protein (cupin superfamily)
MANRQISCSSNNGSHMKNSCNPLHIAENLSQYWFPKVIAEVDDNYVKVAKLKGSFVWHNHQEQDELFLILKGTLVIEYENTKVELNAGDLHVVPRGAMHNPIAEEECLVMLIEHKETAHTGDTEASASRSIQEQLE